MNRAPAILAFAIAGSAAWVGAVSARAEESAKPVSPYIDYLKQNVMGSAPEEKGSLIESEKKRLGPAPEHGDYIHRLQETDPELGEKRDASGYSEAVKQRLEPDTRESAIQAVREGHSELKMIKKGAIHYAAGFRIGTAMSRSVQPSVGAASGNSFDSVYGGGWTPDIHAFYEYQPFHSEWFGNFGIVGDMGLSLNSGSGIFSHPPVDPYGTNDFGSSSHTKMRFVTLPVGAGLNYRFNLLRILRPYVQAMPGLIGYVESRNDSRSGFRGYARTLTFSGGVAILADFINPKDSWELYQDTGIHHTYFTIDYTHLTSFGGDVDFGISGISAGVTYEF